MSGVTFKVSKEEKKKKKEREKLAKKEAKKKKKEAKKAKNKGKSKPQNSGIQASEGELARIKKQRKQQESQAKGHKHKRKRKFKRITGEPTNSYEVYCKTVLQYIVDAERLANMPVSLKAAAREGDKEKDPTDTSACLDPKRLAILRRRSASVDMGRANEIARRRAGTAGSTGSTGSTGAADASSPKSARSEPGVSQGAPDAAAEADATAQAAAAATAAAAAAAATTAAADPATPTTTPRKSHKHKHKPKDGDSSSSNSSDSSSSSDSSASSSSSITTKSPAGKTQEDAPASDTAPAPAPAPAITFTKTDDAGDAGAKADSSSSCMSSAADSSEYTSGSGSSSSSYYSSSSSSYYTYSSDDVVEEDDGVVAAEAYEPRSLVDLIADVESPFGEPDADDNIQLEANPGPMTCTVRAGTLAKLVERLTSHEHHDMQFSQAFLLTYRSFTTPYDLMEILMLRWFTPPPEGLDEEGRMAFEESALKPIRLRVLKVLKDWLSKYTYDFRSDNGVLLRQLMTFAKEATEGTKMAAVARQMRTIAVKRLLSGENDRMAVFDQKPPPLAISKSLHYKKFSLLKIPPVEFARQITLIEENLYHRINPWEFLNQGWTRKEETPCPSPHLIALVQHANHISRWAAMEILSQPTIKRRIKAMERVIEIALQMRELNNFNGVMEILAALQMSSIYRLRKTWDGISDQYFQKLELLKNVMSRDKNYKAMRDVIRELNPPIIPYVGMWLTDLTFIEDGNQDDTAEGLINFDKRFKIAAVIRDVQQYQQAPYCLRPHRALQKWIMSQPQNTMWDEDRAYQISLELEPRPTKKQKRGRSRSLWGTLRRKKKKDGVETVEIVDG